MGAVTADRTRRTRRRLLIALLLLLLFVGGCSYLEGSAASVVSLTFSLNDDARRMVADRPAMGAASSASAERAPSGRVPRGTRVATGGADAAFLPQSEVSVDAPQPSDQEGDASSIAPDASAAGPLPAASAVPAAPASARVSRGRGGGGGGGGGAEPRERDWVLSVRLRSPRGTVFTPRYHFEDGLATVSIDDRRFTPGFYTLLLTRTDRVTGERETTEQLFPWGVLAMNTDADRYRPGETGAIAIGVLDEAGAIICDAALTLTVTAPSGAVTLLSTAAGTIRTHDTCGAKIAGLRTPDYETAVTFAEEGVYALHLHADRGRGAHPVSTLESDVLVTPDPPVVIARTAATRLWPVAPSLMEIRVTFREAFTGTVEDRVPLGFALANVSPAGTVRDDPGLAETVVQWSGAWAAGETAVFSYVYDAPDVSPEFYLVGPLRLSSTAASSGGMMEELRSWQIANDDLAQSASYDMPVDGFASGGGEQAVSNNYLLADTLGEPIIGPSQSDASVLDAGYRQEEAAEGATIGLACDAVAALGSIVQSGTAETSFTCTVSTENSAGYSLSWQVLSGSGGTATGSLINALEQTIPPYRPATEDVPETWSVAADTSAWGGRLRSVSTDADARWGTDDVSEKWLNIGTGSTVIASRDSATLPGGSTQVIAVRVEVGSLAGQPPGTYRTTVTMTASVL